jgi:hypothetical protein
MELPHRARGAAIFPRTYRNLRLDALGVAWNTKPMTWEMPAFVEIEMNAEIGSYQEDFDNGNEGI